MLTVRRRLVWAIPPTLRRMQVCVCCCSVHEGDDLCLQPCQGLCRIASTTIPAVVMQTLLPVMNTSRIPQHLRTDMCVLCEHANEVSPMTNPVLPLSRHPIILLLVAIKLASVGALLLLAYQAKSLTPHIFLVAAAAPFLAVRCPSVASPCTSGCCPPQAMTRRRPFIMH